MNHREVNLRALQNGCPTRRAVLKAAATTLAGLAAAPVLGSGKAATGMRPRPQSSRPTTSQAVAPWWVTEVTSRARVVEVTSPHVFRGIMVDSSVIGEMLDLGMQSLTGARSLSEAWRAVLGPAKRVVVKFNHVGAEVLRTNPPLAERIITSLGEAGYADEDVTLVEAGTQVRMELGVCAPEPGWGGAVPVGRSSTELANYLYAADAIINVSLLKTHEIAGMSGAMKNISHGVIRHPARFHDNACSPYVGQLIGHPEISRRLRLNIVNGLRAVLRNGPDANPCDVLPLGQMLFGLDPVAVDACGQEVLIAERRKCGIVGDLRVPYLDSAGAMGVGRRQPHEVERVPVRHGG